MTYAIQAEGLVKRFKETEALAGVDLAARTGSVLGLLGPNGAGKTTAVRIFATLLSPDGGRATVAGHDVVREAGLVRSSSSSTSRRPAWTRTAAASCGTCCAPWWPTVRPPC
ncbi:ABC-type multidrug transport system ATPase subunit [Streptomyces sp. V4I23]|nr:ABC-type multidrug transport system ATPase subunit [Streptomyces sp. V4I23]